jgi:MoaA/NifB/PqqE/SkfB family radical SAM enzyme
MQTCEFPNRLTLELTNHCNYSCVMCPARIDPGQPRGFMDSGLFRRLVDEAAEHPPVALVPFFRGESLMHPHILELLCYAKSKGLGPIQLASNAALLDESMAKGLLDAGLDFISFSLDSGSPENRRGLIIKAIYPGLGGSG